MRRIRATSAAVLCAAVLLAGCSVEVVDDDATPTAGASDDGSSGGTDAGAGTDGPPDGDDHADADDAASPAATRPAKPRPGATAGTGLPTRTDLLPVVTTQQTCVGGDLDLPLAGTSTEVTDDCATLTVSGAAVTVVAGDVADLVVAGAGSVVLVRSAGTVTITAADVTVLWESGAPRVADQAAGSTYAAVAP